ncbi:GT4 family glycosyltransferase PelF [Exiguobacterium sp. UBA6309]|uniref:GT4 family glycosyltransferase PelF n=1 Tax=Exiguobacterium sp. UBA6309 TaxID=1946499 RepID=UPI0025C158DA|nr:GT4 family glycosyltransferase PelF [Exiguobacterium sp. UBA6309]
MKIGLVLEGSYPYVSGGVASWAHMLIQQMPEHEFELITITPTRMTEAEFRYTLPVNVVGVTNLPLDQTHEMRPLKQTLTPEQEEDIKRWMRFQATNTSIFPLFGQAIGTSTQFFTSRLFFDLVKTSYREEQQADSFIDYLWMWRSMYAPVLELLQAELPTVDLIHSASTGYAGLVAAAIKQRQQVPFVLTEHGIYSREREEELVQAMWIPQEYRMHWVQFFHHLSREAYEGADNIITLFDRNGELQRELGAPAEKIRVIPNGIDATGLAALGHLPKQDVLRIGAIVRIVPIKDIKTMIHAAKVLQEMHVPFEMTIMGPLEEDPEYARECQEQIDLFELSTSVKLVGKVDIRSYLPSFDVCLLTSISEGQPLAVLEGMAAGIPWVVTDVGACSELINGREDDPYGPAGFVVPPVNPRRIAERCAWFQSHPEEAIRFGQNGKERALAYYQTRRFISEYQTLYQERGVTYGGHRV